jgi:hypothetical protein
MERRLKMPTIHNEGEPQILAAQLLAGQEPISGAGASAASDGAVGQSISAATEVRNSSLSHVTISQAALAIQAAGDRARTAWVRNNAVDGNLNAVQRLEATFLGSSRAYLTGSNTLEYHTKYFDVMRNIDRLVAGHLQKWGHSPTKLYLGHLEYAELKREVSVDRLLGNQYPADSAQEMYMGMDLFCVTKSRHLVVA